MALPQASNALPTDAARVSFCGCGPSLRQATMAPALMAPQLPANLPPECTELTQLPAKELGALLLPYLQGTPVQESRGNKLATRRFS